MACIPIPAVPLPELPFPLTFGVTTPPFDFDPALCCKLLPFPIALPPIPLPLGTLNPAVVGVIMANLQAMNDFVDALPLKCPRE
jgi:hypothetical protein